MQLARVGRRLQLVESPLDSADGGFGAREPWLDDGERWALLPPEVAIRALDRDQLLPHRHLRRVDLVDVLGDGVASSLVAAAARRDEQDDCERRRCRANDHALPKQLDERDAAVVVTELELHEAALRREPARARSAA